MQWEKKICIRLTTRRILGAVLTASTVVNLVIVGAAFEAAAPLSTPTLASVLTVPPSTTAFFSPPSTAETVIPFAWTETLGSTPIQLFTPTDTPISPPGWILCIKRFYWSDYRVQPGDTLYSLAISSGSTINELMLANCLPDDRINYGQILYVPRLPIKTFTPTPSPTVTNTPTTTASASQTRTNTPITPSATPTPSSTNPPSVTPTYSPTATQTSTNTPTDTPLLASDLVVTVLQVTDSAKIVPQQDIILVPIYVIVNNQGQATADIFKLSAHYAGLGGKFVAPFSVSGQSNNWYPYSTAPLAVGHEVTFAGIVTLPAALQGQTVVLSVLTDSCSGDESMPTYCRVAESNESNNESPLLDLLLPSNYPPSVTISVPDADKTYIYGDKILLSGSAIDREDDVLGGSSLVWSNEGTTLGPGAEVDVTSYLNDSCGVWYPFTLTATDRDGNATTATRKIYIDCSLN